MANTGRTHYSEKIQGNRGNYNFGARFDMSDGYLGITQIDGDAVPDRVLLSPKQVQALLDFIDKMKTRRAASTTPTFTATSTISACKRWTAPKATRSPTARLKSSSATPGTTSRKFTACSCSAQPNGTLPATLTGCDMKLTPAQKTTLELLWRCGPRKAYPGIKLGTLNSLALKGLVKADRSRPGAIAMPNTSIVWSLSEAGIALFHEHCQEKK